MTNMYPAHLMGYLVWPPQLAMSSQLMEPSVPKPPIDPRTRYWIFGTEPFIPVPLGAIDREHPEDPPRSPKDAWAQRPPKSPKEYPGSEPPRSPKNPRGGAR